MAVTPRNTRQFGSIFQKNFQSQLENFGQDRFGDAGDQVAAFRARLSLDFHADAPLSGTGGQSATSQPVRSLGDAIEVNGEANGRAPTPIYAPPVPTLVLAPGGLAIIHYSSEDSDDPSIPGVQAMNRDTMSFVLLAPLASGATIFFTDRAWNGTTFAAAGGGEGTFTFTAGSNLAAGYVVTITTAQLNAAGINLTDTGETIYAYQGAINAPTSFIYALEIADGNNTFAGSLVNTGLSVAANTATAIGADNASHAARTWNIQIPDLLDSINDPNDWVTNDNSPQYPDETGTNLFTAPDRQIWIAGSGGGDGIQVVNTDGTASSNLLGYAISHLYQNTSVDGNPTTQRFWHPTDVVLDTVNDKFFIVDSDGTHDRLLQGSISQALSNPGVAPTMTVLYRELPETSDGSGLTGLAIDTANQDIYFTRNQFLMRVDYNTPNQVPVTLADLGTDPDTANPTYANEIGLDLSRGFVYIVTTESFSDFLPPPAPNGTVGTVMYRNAIIRVSNVAPGDTNATGNTVQRVLWSGVYDETNSAATGTPQASEFEDQFGKIISVDVNTTNGDIWFTTVQLNAGANGELGGIYRASVDAGGNATVTLVFQETNATNFNFQYIEIDEETGRYYVTSQEPNEANDHSLFSGLLTDAAVQPTFVAHLGNINGLSPLGLSVQSAPTLAGTGLTPTVVETASPPASGETTQVALYSGLTAADIDPPTGDELAGAQVRISLDFQSGAGHQDFLRISGNTSGTIAGSGITYSYDSTNGVLTLSGAATVAEYAAALQMVTFSTSGDNPTAYGNALGRIVSASVFDGLLYSDELTATVTVTGVNDAPVNTPGAAATVNEDSSANAIAGVSVLDVDADPANHDIVVTLSVAHGTISVLTNVAGGIIAADITGGANGSATITITATQNQINATLAAASGLTYTPTGNYNGADALTIVTNDNGNTGTGGPLSDTDAKVINITPVNDAPTVIDATQTAATILEDTPSTLGETVSSLFTASFSDALDQQQTGGNPTGSVANTLAGIAVVGGSTGASGSWQYFNGAIWVNIGAASTASAVLISAGTAIRFNPALNFNGSPPDLIAHLVDSSGAAITNGATVNLTGATGGTTRYSSATVALSESVTAVNDAPVNTVGGTLTVAEDSGATAVTGMSISDVDANPATDVFTVTLDVLHGNLNVLTSVPGGVGAGNVAGNGGATVTLTGTINQINATLAAAGGLTYTPTGNYNGSDRVQITTDDGGATGLDPGATGTATSESDTDSKTINVTAVNDPVTTAAPPTLTVAEDATNVAVAGLSISDIDTTLAPAGVYDVTLSSTNGTMTLTTLAGLTFTVGDGTSDATMTFHGTLAAINTALATAAYTPTANYNGSATITLSATDTFGGIVATGTGAATSDSDVITVTVTAANDPVTTAAPATLTLNEDATNVAVAGLSISDIDATLAPAGVYEVTLSATAGTMTLTTLAGLTFTAGDGTSDATMTFHGTLAAINTALATANYTPPSNYNGPAQITLSATDTFGGIVATGTGAATSDSDIVNVTVTAVNDTPVVSLAATGSSTEQVAGTVDATATIADIDLDALNGGNGNYSGATLTIANNGGNNANDLFAIGASGAFTVNGSNLEAGGLVFATFSGGNGTPLVISFTSSGTTATTALVNAVAQSIQYTYTGDNPPVAGIDVAVSLNDGAPANAGQGSTAGHPATGTDVIHLSITDTPENAPPTLDLDGNDSNTVGTGYTASFTEGGAAVLITDSDVAIADVDVGDMIEGATITINGVVAGDQLILGAQAAPFVVTGSGTGTITITGTGTAAQYEAMLEQITFSNGTDDPGATRTINITVTDGTANSNIAVATINIAEVNDEPTLTATAVNPTFTEGGAAVDLFSGVTADTIEAGQTFVSLTLTVTNVTDGANEILVVGGMNVALTNGNVVATPAGNVTVTLAAGVATVVVGPSTLSEAGLQTLIDGLAYLNTSENPTDANRVVTITQLVDSGSDTSPSDATLAPNIASTVDVNAVNDAPIATVPGLQTINEDGSFTLSTGNGNAISVADADATTLTVTLSVAHGTLTLASTLGLTFGPGDGTADTTMTFSGTAAAINAALGSGLTYNPNADFNGSDAISMQTTDNGQTGTGPVGTDTDTVPINITAINDAPVVIGDGTESATTINEDTPGAGQTINALFAGQYSDAADNQIPNGGASSPGQFSGIAVTANGSSAATGQWQYFSGGVWTDIGAVSDGAAKLLGDPFVTLIRFNPAPDYNGPAPTLTVHLIDNSLPFGIVNGQVVDISGVGATGGTTAYSTGTVVLSQDITAVNDGPLNTVPGSQTINEDASFTLSTGNGNAIQVADADATTLTVTLTVLHGTLTLASTAGLSFSGGSDGTADATMTFSGTAAAINAALGSGLTYNPTANYNGPDSIAVLTTDNGQTGTGGTLQDNDSIGITVNSVNDAPSGANNTLTGSEDDPLVLTAADFGFSDPIDGNAFLAVIIDTFPANGTLFLDSDGPGGAAPVDLSTLGPGVFVSVTDINLGHLYFQPDPDEFGNGYAQFNFRVQDDGGMLNGGVDRDPVANTIFINITPDNLPPVVDLDGATGGVNYTTTFVEDGAAVAIGSGVSVTDPNSGIGDMIESATITLTDRVAGDSLTLTGALVGFVVGTTSNAGSITITITGPGTGAQYQAMIQSIQYATTSQDPTVGGTDLARTVTVIVNDGLVDSAVATTTINITAIDDLPMGGGDLFTITESGTIVAGNLFANDSDPDGPPLAIASVTGGPGANVGTEFTLDSGAKLTVHADGTFDYNPGTVFLPTPTAGSGASNTPSHDSFMYTLAGGTGPVTVTITLTGLDTDDTLLGTVGTDILMGGNGNDTYYVENSSDQVIEISTGGDDRVIASVSYALAAGTYVETLQAAAAAGAINLTGNEFDQLILGNGDANVLFGGLGADVLEGGAGSDVLYGEGGADISRGGTGDDTYIVDNLGDVLEEIAGEGNDAVLTQVSYALTNGASVELLSTTVHAGTAAINLTGNYYDQTVIGNYGANVITGGVGTDVLIGLNGDDTYIVHAATASVIEDAGGGNDIVFTSVSFILGAGSQVETLSTIYHAGTAAIDLVGNSFAQAIYGNAAANNIRGGGGGDSLYGFGGNDTYFVISAADQVFEQVGNGADAVYSKFTYTLAAGQEIEFLSTDDFAATTLINLTGNEFANTIYGNNGDNILDGKGGNDALVGLAGADKFAFTTALGANNVDLIFGFQQGVDKILLDHTVFTGGSVFNTHIIYNSATGQLFYDADGGGIGAAIQFATLSPGLALGSSDFMVI